MGSCLKLLQQLHWSWLYPNSRSHKGIDAFACQVWSFRHYHTENKPQFDSTEFESFTKKWDFKHDISSPRYAQSTRKIQNPVKTVKRLFTKCKEMGQSEYMALLDWRNTPTESIGTSPVQRFFGHQQNKATHNGRTPTAKIPTKVSNIIRHKSNRCPKKMATIYYDCHARPLKPIMPGETVRLWLLSRSTWITGTCNEVIQLRSYKVQVDARQYRCNQHQLLKGWGTTTFKWLETTGLSGPRQADSRTFRREYHNR